MAHFTVFKRHPNSGESMGTIMKIKNKPARSYIERFNREVVLLKDVDFKMKKYMLTLGLQRGWKFI